MSNGTQNGEVTSYCPRCKRATFHVITKRGPLCKECLAKNSLGYIGDGMSTESAVKHTPGPWTITEIGTIEDDSHNPRQIAAINPCNREANARLIAAAPDMLEALALGRDLDARGDVSIGREYGRNCI